jgi:tRNA pseudouridine38-40 synthase
MALKLTLEYDGTGFAGWAAQPGLRTVEGAVTEALRTALGEPVELSVAGRTDAGVHAWGQVASARVGGSRASGGRRDAGRPADDDALLRSLNGLLPPDVAVRDVARVAADFDARRDARARTYCYRVLASRAPSPFERGRSLWWPHPLDPASLSECAASLVGTRNFIAFTPTQTDHVRFERDVSRAEWRTNGPILEFWVEADAFMRHMVRVLVGTMLDVAAAKRSTADFARLLEGAPRAAAGETAPAHGLYLASVRY